MSSTFPYPAKKPGGCRFSGFPDYANHQDYGEEEVEVNDKDFQFWEKIQEDPDVVTLSRVGMDKRKRCLLAREYYIPGKPYGGTWKRRHYHDENGYSAIPYTGGGNWWSLESDCGTLAEVNDDGDGVRYKMNHP